VPTQEILEQQLLSAIEQRQTSMDDRSSWLGNMRALIRIRKEGEPTGDDDESVIARIEAKLKKGDVANALKESEGLSSLASGFFAAWKDTATHYVSLHEALYALELDLTQSPLLPESL
jgi:hypothetical protein